MRRNFFSFLFSKLRAGLEFVEGLFFSIWHIRFYRQIIFVVLDCVVRMIATCLAVIYHAGLFALICIVALGVVLGVPWALTSHIFPSLPSLGVATAIFLLANCFYLRKGWREFRDTSSAQSSARYNAKLRRDRKRNQQEKENGDNHDWLRDDQGDNWWRG